MNSCIYKCTVMHNRLSPKPHKFHYNYFLCYIDLDEIDILNKKLWFMSRNRFNLFNFKDSEHLQLPMANPDKTKNIKEHILTYLKENGINEAPQKIMLLSSLNVLGYNFNPVSFYFCYNKNEEAICCVAEVSNTFREMKPYFLSKETFSEGKFSLQTQKLFYVSPFIEHDTSFDFQLALPNEKLNLRIDDIKKGDRFFISTLTGIKKPLTDAQLLLYFFHFPLVTIKVITLIHWNAMLLWLKKIRYYKKGEFPELQKDVYKSYKK